MSFNSLDFALFLPIVFVLYWFVVHRSLRAQNTLIVLASYFFYSWWDWRFLFLILISTVVDYAVARKLDQTNHPGHRKVLLWISLGANLGILGFFKYFNFFIENFSGAFSLFGHDFSSHSLNIVLPVGISFYTFQTLSYTIDVYRRNLKSTKDFLGFAAFVSFFPQLVAGPIERATNLLPQMLNKRKFQYDQAVDGLRQILWGLFKKIVIADNCAEFANQIFNHSDQLGGSTLVLGAVFFAFQIYGDFSGYSDIAIGTARLFGIDLMQNFAYPYFSRNVAEFWRRWHISLSTWFRDYLYIPLGGSRGPTTQQIRNVLIIFIVSGFWHGANWTFIFWGGLHALYFLPLLLWSRNRRYLAVVAADKKWPSFKEIILMLFTFCLTTFAWVFFRAESIGHAFRYVREIFSSSLWTWPQIHGMTKAGLTLSFVLLMLLIEWMGRRSHYAIASMPDYLSKPYRWLGYLTILLLIYFFGNSAKEIEFIYFQF